MTANADMIARPRNVRAEINLNRLDMTRHDLPCPDESDGI